MKGNTTNHPTRKGIGIKPSKGGRIVRRTFALTVADDHILQAKANALGISLNDFLARAIRLDSSLFKC